MTAAPPKPYDRIQYRGHTFDRLTVAAIEDAERKLDPADKLNLTQGSYTDGFGPSAGTHGGGGAGDAIPKDLAQARRWERALRSVGFMAYVRTELWRDGVRVWPLHVHFGLLGNRKASAALRAQFEQYLAGRDALASNGPDTGPRQFVNVRYRWRRGEVGIRNARVKIDKALAALTAYNPAAGRGVRGYNVQAARDALRLAKAKLPNPDRK